ncbi:MAG: polysaccharide biosynthesis/export family protein [Alphaproteobacteria bacterium]
MKKTVFAFLLVLATIFLSIFAQNVQAATEEFTVLPGDVLQVTVWKEEGMDREVQVLSDGTITFPLIGTVVVKGKTLPEIQSTIKALLAATIPEASVTVSVNAPLGHKVSILGQVQNPGETVMNTNIGVMQLISQAGGLTPYADEDKITIIRTELDGNKRVIEYPYKNISRGRDLDKDINLKPRDVVVVPSSGLF